MRIKTGVRCVARQPATVFETVRSLHQAGFTDLNFFVDGEFEELSMLRCHGVVSQRESRLGGWPNFLLGAMELFLRDPNADAYMVVEDDVVFCRDIMSYLERMETLPKLASLYTSQRVEQKIAANGIGFTRLDPGWHVSSGALALLFCNQVFERMLHSEFVVGYRKRQPADLDKQHFRSDGLHHTDCVVGHFANLEGCGIQYHYPSLAQHIGVESVMYPGFTGKSASRCSQAFPGEAVSALELC